MSGPDDQDMGLYKSLPKESFHIRLLQIRNATQQDEDRGDWKVPIRCTLTTFPFDENLPSYRCLSYVWGKPEPHDIFVNDKTLSVSKNLIGFLRRLRYGSSDPDGYLWIDAICIDQSKEGERTSQVRQMDKIYARASAVIAWLGWEWDRIGDASDNGTNPYAPKEDGGPCTEIGTEAVIEMIEMLATALRTWSGNDLSKIWSGQLTGFGFDEMRMYTMLGIQPQTTMAWRALGVFLDRCWFTRAWIVQEAVLAKRLICVLGLKIVKWEDIIQVAMFLQASGWYNNIVDLMQHGGLTTPPGYRALLFASLREVCQLRPIPWSLGGQIKLPSDALAALPPSSVSKTEAYGMLDRFIINARPFGATDPRDKVFAPLLLCSHTLARFDISLPQPDYTRLSSSVYNDITAIVLERSADLYLLSQVEDGSAGRLNGLASWTPDYSQKWHSPLVDVTDLHYDALGSREKKVSVDWRTGSVELEGCFFDTLASFPGPEGSNLEDMYLSREYRPLLEYCLQNVNLQHGGQDPVEALWRTLTGNAPGVSAANFKRSVELRMAISQYGGMQKASITPITDWSPWRVFDQLRATSMEAQAALPSTEELAAFAERWRRIMTGPNSALVEAKTIAGPAEAFAIATGRVYGNRKVAHTSRGVLGLVPASATEGDQVFYLSGSTVPFVLRPVKSAEKVHTVVGEAYMHGYMNGEVLEENPVFETVTLGA